MASRGSFVCKLVGAMDRLTSYGQTLETMAGNVFDDGNFGGDEAHEFVVGDDPLNEPMPKGQGYELSFMHYKDGDLHNKPYFVTTQLGSPFPSYHMNPLPKFPARWTLIPNVRPPCESISAPRIRLAPQELAGKVQILDQMINAAAVEVEQPLPVTLNLSHQTLGDPYQYQALRAFLGVNRRVEVLNLNDNELEDIQDLVLTRVRVLHLSHNNFVSFDAIPHVPQCEVLHLKNNFLSGFSGLSKAKFPRLKHLTIDLNPIQHKENYFETIKSAIPTLETIDGARRSVAH